MFKAAFSLLLVAFVVLPHTIPAQKSILDYATKNNSEKIQKNIMMDAFSYPAKGKAFRDGRGKTPYLTSTDQLPKRIALVTFNITDLGVSHTTSGGGMTVTTYTSLTDNGGNLVATTMHDQTIAKLKEEFQANGATLLTPDEYLDTPEKKKYYEDEFAPNVSKLGKFLSNIENRSNDITATADDYRYFDLAAAWDFHRSESMGADLAKHLGVDAVFSIGVLIQSNGKEVYMRSMKMVMHGPNPITKEDKKYPGQKMGTGYNNGQLYVGGTLAFKKPIEFIEIKKGQLGEVQVEGLEVIFQNFIGKFYGAFNEAIDKNK